MDNGQCTFDFVSVFRTLAFLPMRYVSLGLFIVALLLMQVLIGGAGLVFSLPANMVLALAGALLLFSKREPLRNSLTGWTSLATLLLGAYVMGRALQSPVEYLARWDFFLTLSALVAYLAVSLYFVRSTDRLIAMGLLMALALAHVVTGGIQFKQGDNYMLLPGIIRSQWEWRASGFYIYPNHLAGLLEMLGLMSLSICCWGQVRTGVRLLAGYCTLMSIAGIAITGSRGGYLSTVFGLLVFCAISLWVVRRLRADRLWPIMAAALIGVVLLLGGAVFVMTKSDSMAKRLTEVYDPTNMRPLMWQASLQQFRLSPVTGTGSGTYLYYGRTFRSPKVQQDPIFVHNDYLHLLAEYGVIGAVLGFIFLMLHLFAGCCGLKRIVNIKLKPDWRTSSNELALVAGALSGIAALLLHSLVDFNFHLPGNALIGAVFLAILGTPSAEMKAVSGAAKPRFGWLLWLVPALALALLALSVRLMPGEYFNELSRRAVRDGRYAEGRSLAERALTFERKNPNVYFNLAEARHYLTQEVEDLVGRAALHEQAAEAYEAALKLFPRDTRLLLKLGATLDLAGRFDDAETIYQRAIANDPNFGNVYAYYGMHFKLQRRFKKAEENFRKARELEETQISVPALEEIDRLRKSELGRRMLSPEEQAEPEPAAPPPAP